MAISGISTSGLISGLNVNELVSQLISVERRPITLLKSRQKAYELEIAAVLSLSSKLSSYKSSLDELNSASKFNTNTASVTKTTEGTELLTVSATSAAADGSYSIKVNQLATASKKASQGWVDQNTTAIASAAGSLKFKVGIDGAVATVAITTTTTLQGLRDAINTANAGVTASIIDDGSGSDSYRLILSADSTGSANTVYITQNNTDLDYVNKKIETVYENTTNTYAGNVYNNSGDYYTGTDSKTYLVETVSGGATGTATYKYSVDGGINWLGYGGQAYDSTATDDTDGGAITTKTNEGASDFVIDATNKTLYMDGSPVTIAEGSYDGATLAAAIDTALEAAYVGAEPDFTVSYDSATRKFTITKDSANPVTFNWSDSGVTAAGVLGYDTVDSVVAELGGTDVSDFDAGMFIDGDNISGSNNDFVKIFFGTTGTLGAGDKFTIDVFNPDMKTAQDAVIQVDNTTITKSTNTISDVINGVTMGLIQADTGETLTLTISSDTSTAKSSIASYITAYNSLFEFLDGQLSYDPDTGASGALLGDPTALEIRRRISNIVTGAIPGLSSSSYTNLSQIGITSDYKTGRLTLDEDTLATALGSDPDAVSKLFIGMGTASNAAITYVSKTSDTQAGNYGINISTAPEQATISGDNDLATNSLLADEKLIFLYAEDHTSSKPTYSSFSVTLTANSKINTIVNDLNSAFATNDVGLSASRNTNGSLKITSTNYGEDAWFQATTDQLDATQQIWATEYTNADDGIDITGSINNHVATGYGNVLTANSSFGENGLKISTTSNQTGGMGTISISIGIADWLPSILDSYVDSNSGVLSTKEESIQNSVDSIQDRIDILEIRAKTKETSLIAEFARLEVLLGRYSTMSQYLADALSSLPGIIL